MSPNNIVDEVQEVVERIGAKTKQEKEAWVKVIEGITTIVFCQLRRRIEARPSYYGPLSDDDLKGRIKENLVTSMLKITDAVTKIRESLDYGKV